MYVKAKKLPVFSGSFPYIIIGLLCIFGFVFLQPFAEKISSPQPHLIQWYAIPLVLYTAIWSLYSYYKKKITAKQFILFLMVIGFLLRLTYILYTPWNVRQHDMGTAGSSDHMGYIYYIFNNSALPDSNIGQFYHPPLHHFICAVWLKVTTSMGFTLARAQEGLQFITLFYSSALVVVIYRILKALKLSDNALILCMAVIAIHPSLIIMGGSINNDILMWLLFFSALLYLIRWYYKPDILNTVMLGLTLGLSMCAKVSSVTLALVIAPVFIYKFIKTRPLFKQSWIYGRFALFGAISIPIGMFFPLRSLILFKQPLGYVLPIPTTADIYCGDKSIFSRFLSIPADQISSVYCQPQSDYNLPAYTLKCSIFGEYDFWDGQLASKILLAANIILILFVIACFIYVMVSDKRRSSLFSKACLTLLLAVQLVSFVYFNIAYPYGCTMDFRYILPLLLAVAFIGMAYDTVKHKEPKYSFIFTIIAACITGGFAVCTAWTYLSVI